MRRPSTATIVWGVLLTLQHLLLRLLRVKHDPECDICAVWQCPHSNPLHLHRDGCPSCDKAEGEMLKQICIGAKTGIVHYGHDWTWGEVAFPKPITYYNCLRCHIYRPMLDGRPRNGIYLWSGPR